LGEAADRYLATKTNRGHERSSDERRTIDHLKTEFGKDTLLVDITAAKISEYRDRRLTTTSARTGRLLTAAAVNRPLATLRHLLQLARDEWQVLPQVPRIKLAKEPEGKIVWLEPDEEARLLAACRASRTKHLADVVTVALESGLRKAEVLGLTWDRVDLSRGVLRLVKTKSGKRREVPMRQAVYAVLAARRAALGDEEPAGKVWAAGDIRSAFESAVKAANLDRLEQDGGFTFHGCRHHFASWFMMRGGSLVALQKILGHAALAMTLRYAHLAPDFVRGEVEKTERGQGASRAQEPTSDVLDAGPLPK
jgi:integrase